MTSVDEHECSVLLFGGFSARQVTEGVFCIVSSESANGCQLAPIITSM